MQYCVLKNRLAKERSPYLRSAAEQPVHWYPWCREAFEEALRLDRPILLEIGAVWCHWCHVIDRESYENGEIAALINENFVAIKVDRDEHPEIDYRYQVAVSALAGQGGWPLTAFLTPRGEVFFGGTYFPPEDRYGKIGLKKILKRIAELYGQRKIDIFEDARRIHSFFEEKKTEPVRAETLNTEALQKCLHILKHEFDFAYGGFGNAPKFFHPSVFELALNQYFFSRLSWLKAVIEKSLEAMGKGGVYDQLGGGFHRYSVDERWVVPQFEKTSYDNASLLAVYSKAFHLFGKPIYREIAKGILAWAGEKLTDEKRGGFYASQDADTGPNDDGDYYTWTRREAEALLTKEEAKVLLPHFDVETQGEMHHDVSRNVLFVAREPEILARELELKPQEVLRRLESAKRKLLSSRRKRKPPGVDTTQYSNWNGMWVRAYFAAYRAFQSPRLKDFALKTLDRFIEKFHPEKGVPRYLTEDPNFPEGLLEDQAEILAAAVEAFELSAHPKYFHFAKNLAGVLLNSFAAPDGGFFDTPAPGGEGPLRFRARLIQDSPTCSANATLASAFLKLYHLAQDKTYFDTAEAALCFFYEKAEALGHLTAGYMRALDFYLAEPMKIIIMGEREEAGFKALRETAQFSLYPYSVILPWTEGLGEAVQGPALEVLIEEYRRGKRPFALVCVGQTCKPIAYSPDDLAKQISGKE